jgi:hypothetical protein
MHLNSCPKIVRGIRWNREDDKGFVYNPFTGKYYEINESAALLMELSDGKTSIKEIIEKIREEHVTDLDSENLGSVVMNYFESMAEEGVVEFLPGEAEG